MKVSNKVTGEKKTYRFGIIQYRKLPISGDTTSSFHHGNVIAHQRL